MSVIVTSVIPTFGDDKEFVAQKPHTLQLYLSFIIEEFTSRCYRSGGLKLAIFVTSHLLGHNMEWLPSSNL